MKTLGVITRNNNITSQTIEMDNCLIDISFCENTRIQSIVKYGPNIHKGILLHLPSSNKCEVLHTNTFYDKEIGSREYLEYHLSTNK
jgi:hypothetical protein